MQLAWLLRGLRTGVVTTRYPQRPDSLPPGFRGQPLLDPARCWAATGCAACAEACLPGAIRLEEAPVDPSRLRFTLDYGSCIMCGLCVAACPNHAMVMTPEFELAVRQPHDLIYAVDLGGEQTNGGVPGDPDADRQ